MSTVLYTSPIFGPVHSRRLGLSLGINLLPADGKVCSFDCVYCECGLNAERRPHSRMPARALVAEKLRETLEKMRARHRVPDTLTFAGNGEPTAHPDFEGIVTDTIALRDEFAPDAKISVLTNAAHLGKESVFRALMRVDNPLLKLDTVDVDYIRLIDRPNVKYDLPLLIERMKAFEGRCIIQTMFLTGTLDGQDVDNTGDGYVLPWLETVRDIAPKLVTIYTIDRETPAQTLKKASPEALDRIAAMLTDAGIPVSVSY